MRDQEIVEKANSTLNSLIEDYSNSKKPSEINFRSVVDWIHPSSRSTHFIHPYPAKLLMQIPNFFLSNNILSKEGDLVFDPFCGSGTVLLESNLNNRDSFGIDINPLATLISRVKTSSFDIDKLRIDKDFILYNKSKKGNIPDVINITYWFSKNIIKELSLILQSINLLDESKNKEFFKMCLSICSRKLSFADPNVSVPVKLKLNHSKNSDYNIRVAKHTDFISNVDVLQYFSTVVDSSLEIISRNKKINYSSEIFCEDIRNYIPKNRKIDLIITSPPYAGAQKYIRATSLNLGWIELCQVCELNKLEKRTVGREHYAKGTYTDLQSTGIPEADQLLEKIYKINPLRAYIASNYLLEMRQSMRNATFKLKKDGYLVLIIGNNVVCGKEFNTQSYMEYILNDLGLKTRLKLFDTIKSRGLMTKRNKTASLITREWVIIFQK